MYSIKISSKFKKDFKRFVHNEELKSELKSVLDKLQKGDRLDQKYKDHELKGIYKGFRECHIRPDFLLVYEIDNEELLLILLRLGSHSEIF